MQPLVVPMFTITQSMDEDRVEFSVNGAEVATFTYDQHGSQAMRDACSMFERIAEELGGNVEHKEV